MSRELKAHFRTDLQVHLVSLHLLRTVMVVQRRLVHLVLTGHLQLVAAQRSEDVLFGEPSVHVCPRQSLNVPEDVGVDPGFELLQFVQIRQVVHLQNVALVQPGEQEVAAEANDVFEL